MVALCEKVTNAMGVLQAHVGNQYRHLSPIIRRLHEESIKLQGTVTVKRGFGLANLLCRLLALPESSKGAELVVKSIHKNGQMKWVRIFPDCTLVSKFENCENFFVEHIGPLELWMKLRCEEAALVYSLEKIKLYKVTLPRLLNPHLEANEAGSGSTYRFSVRVDLPLLGKLIEYYGELQPSHKSGSQRFLSSGPHSTLRVCPQGVLR
jgi:hypothetical protein